MNECALCRKAGSPCGGGHTLLTSDLCEACADMIEPKSRCYPEVDFIKCGTAMGKTQITGGVIVTNAKLARRRKYHYVVIDLLSRFRFSNSKDDETTWYLEHRFTSKRAAMRKARRLTLCVIGLRSADTISWLTPYLECNILK